MSMYYAPSTGGFYYSEIHDTLPEDAVEITEDLHGALLDGQSAGKVIMPPDQEHDLPWLADPPPQTPEQIAATRIAAIKSRLAAIDTESIRPLRAIADGSATDADRAKLVTLEAEAGALREELAGLDEPNNFHTNWPDNSEE